MIITRKFAFPSAWTFTIKPITKLIGRYVGDGIGWIDPFAGENSPAEITNDLNPERPTKYHMEAVDFVNTLNDKYKGILFDPPYSYRQVSEMYDGIGLKASQKDTSCQFYNRVIVAAAEKIELGGYAISFGWNTKGFSKKHGFEIIEILIVNHGDFRNDTLCVVEKKVMCKMF